MAFRKEHDAQSLFNPLSASFFDVPIPSARQNLAKEYQKVFSADRLNGLFEKLSSEYISKDGTERPIKIPFVPKFFNNLANKALSATPVLSSLAATHQPEAKRAFDLIQKITIERASHPENVPGQVYDALLKLKKIHDKLKKTLFIEEKGRMVTWIKATLDGYEKDLQDAKLPVRSLYAKEMDEITKSFPRTSPPSAVPVSRLNISGTRG